MKKSASKLLTAVLTASLLSSMMATTVFASNTIVETWNGSDYTNAENPGTAQKTKKLITAKNINDTTAGLKVTAYQIVKGVYKGGKLTGYTLCDETKAPIANMEAPTESEILTIAGNIKAGETTLTGIEMTRVAGDAAGKYDYQASVEAGLYIVIVTGAGTTVYNPGIVAVNVTDANLIDGENFATGGTVDMTQYFNNSTASYVKSSDSGLNKDIMPTEGKTRQGTEGDIVAYGDTVNFKIDQMTIPYYTDYYKYDLEYSIKDSLDPDGFEGISSLVVQTGVDDQHLATLEAGQTVDLDGDAETTDDIVNSTYTLTYKDKNGAAVTDADKISKDAVAFEVSFSDYYIRNNPQKKVVITYSSKFKGGAAVNFAEHKNKVELTFRNDPTDVTKKTTKKAITYHYTFGIDADIDGQSGENFETYELNKVTEPNKIDKTSRKSEKPLAGAEFTIYSDSTCSNVVTTAWTNNAARPGVATSDANGHITFKGLDVGTYYIKETKVPQGYFSKEGDVYRVVIDATMDDATGILTSYSVEVSKNNATNGFDVLKTSTYTNNTTPGEGFSISNDGDVTNKIVTVENPIEIVNTQTASLPVTGGIGTIIITVLAAAGMAIFMTVFIVNRKKKDTSEGNS